MIQIKIYYNNEEKINDIIKIIKFQLENEDFRELAKLLEINHIEVFKKEKINNE